MILLLDLGNTNLYVGIMKEGTLISEFRTDSDLNRSSYMYLDLLKNFIETNKLDVNDFEGAILSSVIPSLTYSISKSVEDLLQKPCFIISKELKSGLPIRIDNPSELGTDLIADSVGAIKRYGAPCIICDLGTANKLLVIDKNNNFIGCTISPGIKTAQKALSNGAAQLMDISFKAPKKVIGKNSPDSLNSGAIYGTKCMIEGMTKLIEDELGYPTNHILTGGNAVFVKDYIENYTYDPTLIFEGLYQIYLKNR